MGTIDSAATENDEKIEYADEDVSEIIRQYTEEKMNEAGLESDKHPNLAKRVVKRTAALIGLKVKRSEPNPRVKMARREREDDYDEDRGMPFKTIDIRIDTSPPSSPYSSIVKLCVLDGVLPHNVPLPFYMFVSVTRIDDDTEREEDESTLYDTFPEFASSSWPPKTNMVDETPDPGSKTIFFRNILVKSLLNGILLDAKDKQKTASVFDPRNKLKIKMEAYTGKGDVTRWRNERQFSSSNGERDSVL